MSESFNKVNVPQHIAIIMDGNGRWAAQRKKSRTYGHKAGVEALKKTIELCISNKVEVLTVFAFSSENWQRPRKEVDILMALFSSTLDSQVKKLDRNNICLKIIGDKKGFSASLQKKISKAEGITKDNTGLKLIIAANYGGQWDIEQASKAMLNICHQQQLAPEQYADLNISDFLSTTGIPEPDLFIRTGGDHRISNFLLWQLAYCELFFSDTLWPDFDEKEFALALDDFSNRQRRFGKTGEQVSLSDKSA
ncbi:MAG: di-trans,poly-cis-decaprenylcistransferase [Piscirickettsiaceae bacterium]|nr:MAG: di-trans,poly-cis-decaprenylcistransferase [Piscirickettsiaceae bacterium]